MTNQTVFPAKMLVFSLTLMTLGVLAAAGAYVLGQVNNRGCSSGKLDLTGKGVVAAMHTDGRFSRALLARPDGKAELLTFETCGGKILGSVEIVVDQQPAPQSGVVPNENKQ